MALLILTGTLASAGSPQESSQKSLPSKHSMGSRKHYVGLPGFAEVSPNLFRGGQPGADGLEALKKMDVAIIVDMRGGRSKHEEAAVHKLGMRYVSIPWHCPFPHDETFARFLRLIQENRSKKVFVHCRLGDDRTGLAVAVYRMADDGWSAEEAMSEMKEFGFTKPHHVICPTLAHYEREFPKRFEKNAAFDGLRGHNAATR